MKAIVLKDSTAAETVQWPEYKKPASIVPIEARPHCCPVCNGAGTVSRPPWVAGDVQAWASVDTGSTYPCKACSGTGILWR
jgi:hypothetical protein